PLGDPPLLGVRSGLAALALPAPSRLPRPFGPCGRRSDGLPGAPAPRGDRPRRNHPAGVEPHSRLLLLPARRRATGAAPLLEGGAVGAQSGRGPAVPAAVE